MNKLKPNFTQIPNVLLDEWLGDLSMGELKVLLYVMRRTYGFHKDKDTISFSQIIHGIKGIECGTKLGKETLSRAINSLEQKGLLIVGREKMTNSYELNLYYPSSTKIELVPKSNQSSTKIEPKVVPKSNTQKKEKESIQKKVYIQAISLKKKYGELQNVKLTDDEHLKLINRFGDSATEMIIFDLDMYIASKGDKYKSHYATILTWAKRKGDEYTQKQKTNKNNIAFI